jgi:hypothetical protein
MATCAVIDIFYPAIAAEPLFMNSSEINRLSRFPRSTSLAPHLRIIENPALKPTVIATPRDPAKLTGYQGDGYGGNRWDDWE